MPKRCKFRMYLITNGATRKAWQEMRASCIATYTMIKADGRWSLYVKLNTRTYDFVEGNFLYRGTMESALEFLGVEAPPQDGSLR